MEEKIAIITRCRNRLEYTLQCIATVRNNTEYNNYRHVIVDNNSSDGTQEWFTWARENISQWYSHISYIHNPVNSGDWGGMRLGFLNVDADYYVQLDNDITVPPYWLTAMRDVLVNSDYKVVMLKRGNVAWKLKPLSQPKNIAGQTVVTVERAVACYMCSNETMKMLVKKIPESQGMRSKYLMRDFVKRKIGKITNLECQEMEADFQRIKYSPKNKQIWEKI